MMHRFTRGMDVSGYQTPIRNFQSAPDAGLDFVYNRWGNGYDIPDPTRYDIFTGYGKVGMLRGLYHWVRPSQSPLDQARKFVSDGLVMQSELPPAGDFEETTGIPSLLSMFLLKEINRLRGIAGYSRAVFPSVLTLVNNTRIYLAEVERLSKRRPVIYAAKSYWDTYMSESYPWADSYDFWISNPRTNAGPSMPTMLCAADWTMWQWTFKGKGKRYGVASLDLDLDAFNGTRDEMVAWAREHNLEESDDTDVRLQRTEMPAYH